MPPRARQSFDSSFGTLLVNDRPKTRVSLILRLSQPADAEAWEEFCDIYLPVIFRIAKARGLQDADAHDVSQNVLVRVARSVKNWSPDAERGSFGAWLGTIARNLLIDFLRSNRNQHKTAGGSDIERLVDDNVEHHCAADCEDLIDAQLHRQLFVWAAKKVESSVQASTWQAFWRTAVQNERVDAVAEDLEMTAGGIYVARSRVIAKIRKTIESATAAGTLPSHVAIEEGSE